MTLEQERQFERRLRDLQERLHRGEDITKELDKIQQDIDSACVRNFHH